MTTPRAFWMSQTDPEPLVVVELLEPVADWELEMLQLARVLPEPTREVLLAGLRQLINDEWVRLLEDCPKIDPQA